MEAESSTSRGSNESSSPTADSSSAPVVTPQANTVESTPEPAAQTQTPITVFQALSPACAPSGSDSYRVEQIWKGPSLLGEGPLWHPTDQCLYWVDVTARRVNRLNVITNAHKFWQFPVAVSCLAPLQGGGLVGAVGTGFAVIHLPEEGEPSFEPKIELISATSGLRLNDGKCDRRGRFWVGTVASDFSKPDGKLYLIDEKLKVHEKVHDIKVSNGLGWSLDNKVMYYTDSLQFKIFKYNFDEETGVISNQSVLHEFPEGQGVPDGLTVDADGYIWTAIWNGRKVVRINPGNGQIDTTLAMPCQRPTSCMIGGINMDTLFVTSCCRDVNESEAETLQGEGDGGLFAITPVIGKATLKGLAEPAYHFP